MGDSLLENLDRKGAMALKKQYKDNASIVAIVDAHLARLDKEEAEAKVRTDFISGLEGLTASLPHPSDIANVYLAWREVDVPTGEPEEVEVVKDGVKVREMRTPTTKVSKWVVELNKGFQVAKSGTTTSQATTTKRAVSVSKRDGNTLTPVGNFVSATKACEYLKLPIAGDSATRVLARNGYILDAYTSTDFTAPK